MTNKIKEYYLKKRKNIHKKAIILTLFLLVFFVFFINFRIIQNIIFNTALDEKSRHAEETIETIREIDKQTDFFLEKIEEARSKNGYFTKEEKKEIILALRKIESNFNEVEINYFGFYNNDFSIKLFSKNSETWADKLFSQTKNLSLYGRRAASSMEDSLKSNYISKSQLDVLEIEFGEIKEKIKSIKKESAAN